MDLSKMSPKEKQRYEVAFENMTTMLEDYDADEELPEMILAIRRAEYKRGKSDGIGEVKQAHNLITGTVQEKNNG